MAKNVTEEHFDATMNGFRADMHGTFVTKDEFRGEIASFRDEMNTRFDAMFTILQRLDQERIFTTEWIRRVESDVTMLKKHLKLA